jgi:hypothetical protein
MNDLDFESWVCPLSLRDYPKTFLRGGEVNILIPD